MFTHTKTEVDCSPGASTEVIKKEKKATDHASGKRKGQKKQKKKQTNQTLPPATAEKNKIKQPHIGLALSRAGTLTAMDSAPKRKRSGITPDPCCKAGDPHNLEVFTQSVKIAGWFYCKFLQTLPFSHKNHNPVYVPGTLTL